MKFHEINPSDCRPYSCTPLYACEVHAPTSVELKASGWPEPPRGWQKYDADTEANRARWNEPVVAIQRWRELVHGRKCRCKECMQGRADAKTITDYRKAHAENKK